MGLPALLDSHNSLSSLGELRAYVVPVQDLEEGLDVVGTLVLVFEVVGVLPHVDAEYGLVAGGQRAVLVRRGLDRNCAIGQLDQPRPAAAKDVQGGVC